MIQLRDYQITNAQKLASVLFKLKLALFCAEVRTGKTLTALEVGRLAGAQRVLFITKKKAISSIQSDYDAFSPKYQLTVINYESMSKVGVDYDFVICDESHRMGSVPKPGLAAKYVREKLGHLPLLLLTGTPAPESWSQLYHQFWISHHSPFREPNFYKWARAGYVNITKKQLPHATVNDYTDANLEKIMAVVEPYFVRFTQQEAGFVSKIIETVVSLPMPQALTNLNKRLINDLVLVGKSGTICADTPAKLQQKIHQICSGTILLDEVPGEPRIGHILSTYKADYIRDRWAGRKIAIFYKFQYEEKMLKQVLGDRITNDIAEFKATNKSFYGQITASREGINLSEAECIVFLNIDFSALSYWQSRDRMTTIDRIFSPIYWLFGEGGIEEKIYKRVLDKKDYTVAMFKKDFNVRVKNSSKTYQKV